MIRSLTATTREIDDPQAAVTEILTMLALDENLLHSSVGIISCFAEFEDTGALKAICDTLPFECVGTTTCLCSAGKEADEILFAITVLTSDDCSFQTLAVQITEEYANSIHSSVIDFLGQSPEKPALFLSYFPLMNNVSGDMILTAIDDATGGVPLFGLTAIDHTLDYSAAKTIHNGAAFREAAVLCAVYGSPKVEFGIASLDENKFRIQKAIITESDGNVLIGVNGKNAMEYLKEIGFTEEQLPAPGVGAVPLIINYMGSIKPVVRAVFAVTSEGHVACGGKMPVGATLGIGHVDMNDVLNTTSRTVGTLLKRDSVVLCYSCIARYLVLGTNSSAEVEKVIEATDNGAEYHFTYTGGEICPMPDANGNLKNVYHNFTIVFCRLS